MTPITQRAADMAMWQACIMANGDPNCGDLQDAWDAVGEDVMREFAISASTKCFCLWESIPSADRAKWQYADLCAEWLRRVVWSVPGGSEIIWPNNDEIFEELFPLPF